MDRNEKEAWAAIQRDLETMALRYGVEVPWARPKDFHGKSFQNLAAEQEDFRDAKMRATSPVTRAMADQMLADCLARKS